MRLLFSTYFHFLIIPCNLHNSIWISCIFFEKIVNLAISLRIFASATIKLIVALFSQPKMCKAPSFCCTSLHRSRVKGGVQNDENIGNPCLILRDTLSCVFTRNLCLLNSSSSNRTDSRLPCRPSELHLLSALFS